MRPTRLIGILGFVTATTFGGYTLRAAVQAQSNRTDEEAIRRTIVALTDGMNKHDAKAIARLYTRDGDLINVFGGWWKGPAEIENGLKTHFDAELKSAKFTTSDVEIRFIKPDVAIGHVTNQVSGIVGPNGQTVPAHGERSIRVFVKENGSWLMTAFHNTQVAPSEPLVRPRRQDHEAAATFTTGCYYSRRMSRALRQAVVY